MSAQWKNLLCSFQNESKEKKLKRKVVLIALIFLMSILFILITEKSELPEERVADTFEAKSEEVEEMVEKIPLADLKEIDAGSVVGEEQIALENMDNYFTVSEIDEGIFARIKGKSYPENAKITLDELRYIKVIHYNYNHEVQVGELIVNKAIAEDCVNIFRELYEVEYEVESMRLIDDFWTGDSVESDENSIEHNNTSAFNYRVVPGTAHLSNHALGRAIDINPLQNPYVKYNEDGSFAHYYKDMELYLDRESGKAHMITHQDEAYRIFTKYGFFWGGDWNSMKDYQHFEKE